MNKEDLFSKLRRNTKEQFDMPEKPIEGIKYQDVVQQFIEMSHTVGCEVIEAQAEDDIKKLIQKAYPEIKRSAVDYISKDYKANKLFYRAFNTCSLICSNSSFILTTIFCISAWLLLEPVVFISLPIS